MEWKLNIKNIKFFGLLILVLGSCKSIKNLNGKTYTYESKKRTLAFIFSNDSTCVLKNTFHCNDISPAFKEIIINCRCKKIKDTIYLRNVNCTDNNCKYDLTIAIPTQESTQCGFLSENARKSPKAIGPNYSTEYEKFGLVPNIDIDTLRIINNKIVLLKKTSNKSIGFIFK